jgi:hypothetical protein
MITEGVFVMLGLRPLRGLNVPLALSVFSEQPISTAFFALWWVLAILLFVGVLPGDYVSKMLGTYTGSLAYIWVLLGFLMLAIRTPREPDANELETIGEQIQAVDPDYISLNVQRQQTNPYAPVAADPSLYDGFTV